MRGVLLWEFDIDSLANCMQSPLQSTHGMLTAVDEPDCRYLLLQLSAHLTTHLLPEASLTSLLSEST